MRKCSVCQVDIRYNAKTCKAHRDYRFGKKCGTCDKALYDGNKTGFCTRHNKNGSLNPMAGRRVYDVWLTKYGKEEADRRQAVADQKHSNNSKKNWEDPNYRALIKETTTGVKRTEEFRQKQRANAKKQFQDPVQRQLRSEAIRASFERGTHTPDTIANNVFGNRGFTEDGIFYASDVERKRIEFLKASGVKWKRYEVGDFDWRIRYEWEGRTRLYLPDFVIWDGDQIIIEEMKSNLKYISELEWHKARIAEEILRGMGIGYRIIDDPKHRYFL